MGQKLLIFIFFWISCTYSQQSDFLFKNITIDDGLSQNSIVDIAQDSLDFMWFATQDGLNRFDGQNFKIFPRAFDDITNPESSRLGKLLVFGENLWMITRGGKLEVLDLVTEEFEHISRFGGDGGRVPPVRSIFIEAEDQIWLGTEDDGLYLLDGGLNILKHYYKGASSNKSLLSNKINQVHRDSRGSLLILSEKGINQLKQNQMTTVLEGPMVNVITEDIHGRLFAGTQKNGIYIRDWQEEEFYQTDKNGRSFFPTDISVKSIYVDKNFLYIGTYGSGLYLFDRRYLGNYHLLPVRNDPYSIGFQDILSIFQDSKGGMWFGTDGGGVSFYDESFNNFGLLSVNRIPENIPVEQIRAITTDPEGTVWFGTSGNGYSSFDPEEFIFNSFHLEPYKSGIKNYNRIVALHADDSGDLWIGTHGNGTLLKDRKTGKIKKWFTTDALPDEEHIADNTIWTFLQEGPETVWAGSRFSGLFLIHKEKGVIKRFYDRGIETDNVRALEKINDSILALGYETKGVRLLNTRSGDFQPILEEFFTEELDRVEIKCLYYLNGWLWIGTAGKGIAAVELNTGKVERFTEEDGLPNNMIYGILEEDSRSIWASTNRGLFRLTYKKIDGELSIDKINSFDQSNGLQSNEFNTGAYHKGRNGMLYFGGIKGLNYFDAGAIPDRREKINIVISEARVDNIPFQGDKSIVYEDHLKLKYQENSIAVNYQAINFGSPNRLNYTYKLEGYDEDWIEAGSRNYTAYTNLPAGNYVFRVRLADHVIDHAPITSLGISVATPFWQAWWFILLAIFLLFSILYTIYWVRINQFLQLQRVKDSISADLHDDLGSRLTTIHLLSALTRNKFQLGPELSKFLKNIDREVYASSEALDEIVWNIKMTDESLPDIIAKIRRYSSEALESANIAYSIETSEDFGSFELKIQKRRELFLICKELVNNIRKHAGASKVDLRIFTDNKKLYISVLDNGKGFNPHQKTHRNGISNLRKRVEKWKGEVRITSEPEKGCLIEIWIPFERKNLFQRIFKRKLYHPKRGL